MFVRSTTVVVVRVVEVKVVLFKVMPGSGEPQSPRWFASWAIADDSFYTSASGNY